LEVELLPRGLLLVRTARANVVAELQTSINCVVSAGFAGRGWVLKLCI